jgi:hypothetical protein
VGFFVWPLFGAIGPHADQVQKNPLLRVFVVLVRVF